MPFKGVTFARKLIIQGSAIALAGYNRAKIVGTVNAGNPQMQFFTGSPDESGPGLVWVNCNPSFNPDQLVMIVSSPESADGSQASLDLTSNSTGLNITNAALQGDTVDITGGTTGNESGINIAGGGKITLNTVNGIDLSPSGGTDTRVTAGRFRIESGMDFTDSGATTGGVIFGIDMGNQSVNTFNGDGSVLVDHNFGNTNFRAVANTLSGGGARWATRTTANDTSTKMGFRIWNDAGGNPANGTAVSLEWIAVAFAD